MDYNKACFLSIKSTN